jgi:uncharacterized protein
VGPAEAVAIFGAGMAAGAINAIVGSGSLITFPTLLAFGFPPVVANVSNNVGLVPGNVSGAWGYRRELAGQRSRLMRLGLFSVAGSLAGAIALLSLPSGSFQGIVSVLILIACVLVLVQPRLNSRLAARRQRQAEAAGARARAAAGARSRIANTAGGGAEAGTAAADDASAQDPAQAGNGAETTSPVLAGGVFGAAVYGGYFGAAQGVLVIGLLGSFLDEPLQRVNAAKNVLVALVNGTAAIVYIIFAHVAWLVVVLIAAGSTVGGLIGARYGRRLPPFALRLFVVAIGIVSVIKLIVF